LWLRDEGHRHTLYISLMESVISHWKMLLTNLAFLLTENYYCSHNNGLGRSLSPVVRYNILGLRTSTRNSLKMLMRRIPYVGYIRVPSPPDRHSTTVGDQLYWFVYTDDYVVMTITTSIMGIRPLPNYRSKAARQHITIFSIIKKWSQHLITTNILRHADNIICGILDRLCVDQTPYTSMNVMGQISNICRARVPLICFATVE
ncbi:hypothetical protein Lal_00043325, partial [Lupinus albus]